MVTIWSSESQRLNTFSKNDSRILSEMTCAVVPEKGRALHHSCRRSWKLCFSCSKRSSGPAIMLLAARLATSPMDMMIKVSQVQPLIRELYKSNGLVSLLRGVEKSLVKLLQDHEIVRMQGRKRDGSILSVLVT
ncbi:hypothetical protein FVEG_16229 [Fusarium verticillioides 7600]|uniref:Uncharacterized protein n=1 Tax=Gibberella moniliformis (strain M3125 / FGSC 7600) TaxID=334819 RepID=W7MUE6_GIBM7|nr:hypothetical protein FVEG_16229 [Fusarium verticillioides 7600]EWG48007.1 hypothetical protein FVEG_16229 [Fusarium verticillioides 7600]